MYTYVCPGQWLAVRCELACAVIFTATQKLFSLSTKMLLGAFSLSHRMRDGKPQLMHLAE